MSDYHHPHRDIEFILRDLLKVDAGDGALLPEGIDSQFMLEVLNEAAKLATDSLAPLNREGDRNGAVLTADGVQVTPGFAEAYRLYQEGGWASLAAPEGFGGQDLPNLLAVALNEIFSSANLAWGLCPLLSSGAIHAINIHGSDQLKQTWLPNLVSGRWTGTMNLTEPDAGSDLAAIKTRAVPDGDRFLITGQKIFISWGEHSMTDNIVHLVLARLPDAPPGVKGISLFLVPKFLLDGSGEPLERNDLRCVSLEEKMGLHGSPTCTMAFGDEGGAVGYLVGEAHKGLSCMFTMMNHARQAVGVEGLAVSERAYQQALAYARERLQGTNPDGSRFTIIQFPDVRRMLLQMKSAIEAMRALAYTAGLEEDRARLATTPEEAAFHHGRTALYTPIVKGWLTELAQEVTALGIQIHGGTGFIEETGAAQHYRDARVLTIYEGTTGIQALDFVGRKIVRDNGETMKQLLNDIQSLAAELKQAGELQDLGERLENALESAMEALAWMLNTGKQNPERLNAISVSALMLFGYLLGGYLLSASAAIAVRQLAAGQGDNDFLKAKIATAEFYAAHLLPRVNAAWDTMQRDNGVAIAFNDQQF